MAIAQGFGKTSTSGLVFSYDTGDMDNSFKGAPKTNLLSAYSRTYGNQSSSVFKTQYYTRNVFVPTLGLRTVETMETYNDYGGGSGVCCQGAWGFGGSGVSGSTQYTYSIIYRSSSGYTHPNFMYRYEYGSSGYITEGGLHNDGNRTHLGDGWYHAWGNMTTQPGTTTMYFYFYMYEYSTYNTIDIAGVMFTQGPEILRPRQFIPFSTTRTSTQSLLDLTGNGTINLANVSYTGTGELTFDGTDDYISVSAIPALAFGTGNFTAEVMIKPTSFSSYTHMVALRQQDRFALKANVSDGAIYYYDPSFTTYGQTSGWTLSLNQWNHVVLVRQGGTAYTYLNGISKGSVGGFNSNFTETQMNIGWGWGGEFTAKQIAVVKMYNQALSSSEVLKNYNHYKTRFNL